ncbi:MAG: FecR domain-containing protein [Candidatus Thiodiazotropha sp. (ex Epidulcina cf. delphinae)]|nr:FecR domain-containing protein [Candidatus Thiodiazotropha sp. (ex Epidulcina cf. delphinae)]
MIAGRLIGTKFSLWSGLWLLCWGFVDGVAADACTEPVARAVSIQGRVEVRAADAESWRRVQRDVRFCPGDRLRVSADSRAGLYLHNDSFLRLSEQSSVTFSAPAEDGSTRLGLLQGIAHFISRIRHAFQVRTPYVNASIEGTEFTVRAAQGRAGVIVMEGRVRAHNDQGDVLLSGGRMAEAIEGQAPVVKAVVDPRDAVQWALHYPPVVDFAAKAAAKDEGRAQKRLRRSLAAYRQGDLSGAFAALEDASSALDSSLLTYRASLRLRVGGVDAARADIEQALQADPRDADALALMSIIATVQNDTRAATAYAEQAVKANPQAASSHIALSYAGQARFELAQALEAARQATRVEADNPLAWSRLSQLQLMFRNMQAATDAAQRAVAIEPGIALTQTTLGFAHLIRLDLAAAQSAFAQAASLDQAAPLPRLGLGLVLIRRGEPARGRRLLETAANLDPGNALLRSYLGKAYYEEKRGKQAAAQFRLAKQLDAQDPTAWFYDAILKQTQNRPLQALADLQKAIDLNDNRAVYRSRLLLDEDRAARSASLARLYDDLGFRRLALKESRRSLSADPGNASAHRFLSDAYAGTPRHEMARVSELLQAQMLQPEIVSPVSPSAGEASLLAFEGSGPSVAGFNEYNPLFNRRRLALLASGVTGGNNTRGREITAGAFFNRGMLSIGRFTESSDGFRDNNDSDQTIENLFGQYRITPNLSVQGELRQREGAFGDLALRFNPESFDTRRTTIDADSHRLGVNYSPDLRNTFLISAIAQDRVDETALPGILSVENKLDGRQFEGQYIHRGARLGLVSGLRRIDAEREEVIQSLLFNPPPTWTDIDQKSVYAYLHLPWSGGLSVLGFDHTAIDAGTLIEARQFSPKAGMLWDISRTSTLRLAAFRTLRAMAVNDQTLPPTQVAGFNQVFDDAVGTRAWRYGIALDQAIDDDLSGGIAFTRRAVTEIVESPDLPGTALEEDHREQYHEAHLNWSPGDAYALSGRYIYDDFEREHIEGEANEDEPAKMNTRTFTLQAGYRHPRGCYGELEAAHVSQKVTNVLEPAGLKEDRDRFWTGNITLGVRMPDRRGLAELQVRNLFDREFNYQSIRPGSGTPQASPYYPERALLLHLQIWF